MDLVDKMTTYVRVVEAGSFSAAAKQLRLSAAAVSRQISTLEAGLRVSLLARSTRRMAVTSEGRQYYERCLRVLREVEDAQNVGRARGPEGLLQVTAPVTFGLARVVPHIRALMKQHPGLVVDLRLEDRLLDLTLEGVDVGIRVGSARLDSVDLVAQPLLSFRRVIAASPRYLRASGEPKTPEALAKHDALTYPAGDVAGHWNLVHAERSARVRVKAAFRCNALHALRELAVEGAGVALLPDWLVEDEVARGRLRIVLAGWTSEPVPVHAIYRVSHRGATRVRALVDHLRSAFRSS